MKGLIMAALGLISVLAVASLAPGFAQGQPPASGFDDHQNMMDQLGVKALRPGPDPNNQSTFDEATANPYKDTMPDVLRLKNGTKVTKAGQWPKRRAEIAEDFEREVYGRIPRNVPKVTWEVTATTLGDSGGVPILTRTLVGHVDNSAYPQISVSIQASFTTPASAKRPMPLMVEFGGFGNFGRRVSGPTWQQQAIAHGWAYGSITPTSIQPDNNQLTTAAHSGRGSGASAGWWTTSRRIPTLW